MHPFNIREALSAKHAQHVVLILSLIHIYGTTVEGYQSDVTRMGVLGKAPEKLQRAFEIDVYKRQGPARARDPNLEVT